MRLLRPVAALLVGLTVAGCDGPPPLQSAAPRAASVAGEGPPTALVYDRGKDGQQDVYVTPAGGGRERRLTDHPRSDILPRWRTDGRSVLFTSDRSGTWQIWEVSGGGGPARPVRSNAAVEWQVDAAPDGRLAFLSNLEGREALYVSAPDGSAARSLVRHGARAILGNPDWSPDGRRITFSSNWRLGHHIYVVDAAGGEAQRISDAHRGGCEPRFSPDGRRIAWTDRAHLKQTSVIVERGLETGAERVLVDWPALNYDVAYSPDGSEIAFASNATGVYQVYRQSLSDGRSWQVTSGQEDARNPDYAPAD